LEEEAKKISEIPAVVIASLSATSSTKSVDDLKRRERMIAASKAAADAYIAGQRRKVLVAIGSVLQGAALFFWRRDTVTDPITVLHQMESESVRIFMMSSLGS